MQTDPDCVFCRIVAGAIPAARVFENDHVLAFLDIGPLAEGHLLVIPREHYTRLEQMPPDLLACLARCLPDLARAVLAVTGAPGYNLLQNNGRAAGQVVGHVHFHIIPRNEGDGLGYRWNASSYPPGRAGELQRRIRDALAAPPA